VTRPLRALLIITIAFALLGVPVAGALNPALRPLDLRVDGSTDVWHPFNRFRLEWVAPSTGGKEVPFSKIHLRIRDSSGQPVVPDVEFSGPGTRLENIHVPGPGRYTADVWLEGPAPSREWGDPASASLLFDDVRPAPTRPLPPPGWIAGDSPAVITLEHPAGPWPVSGILGYAVSVDDGSGSAPCAGPTLCGLAETDLQDGAAADTLSLGRLRAGLNVVRAVAVSGSGVRSQEVTSAVIRVDSGDPDVSLQAPQGWVDGPTRVTALASDAQAGVAADGPNGPYTAIAVDGGVPRAEQGPSATLMVTGEGMHRVVFYARDAVGNSSDEVPGAAAVRIDETAPLVAFAVVRDPADPERIEATVADSLSGPAPRRGSIAVRPAGSRQPFVTLPTDVSAGRLVAHWDSDAFARRTYEFRATGYDVAGNAAASDRRTDGARMVLTNPVKIPTTIVAGFGGTSLVWPSCSRRGGRRHCHNETVTAFESRPTSRTVPFRRAVAFGGQLSAVGGSRLGGLPITVVETFGAGAVPPQRTTTVRTEADGTFAVMLGPGPSRRIAAVFAGSRTLTRTDVDGVELEVQAGVRLRVSSTLAHIGGRPVTFRGRVDDLGAPIPPRGRPLELQFRLRGGEWSAFRTVQTDSRGRFSYPYVFSDDDSRGVRFQFRAYAPPQSGWPYEAATSRPIFVTGR
jgi:hypothetical protein